MKKLLLALALLPLTSHADDLANCQALSHSLQTQIIGYSGAYNQLARITVAIDVSGFKGTVPYAPLKDASDSYARTGVTRSPNQIISFNVLGGDDKFTLGLAELNQIHQAYLLGGHTDSHTVSSCP